MTLESKSKFAKREKNAPVPPKNSDCYKAVLFAPGLRFDGLVPFPRQVVTS